MKGKAWIAAAGVAAVLVALAVAAAAATSGSAASQAATAKTTVALVSDTGKFNDRSFNQSQLEGLNRAKKTLGITAIPLQSNSNSDYIPNMTNAIRKKANLVIGAGFLLAASEAKVAAKFPKVKFAITDYSSKAPEFKKLKNVAGLTYASNEAGCLVGYLAAQTLKPSDPQVISVVGGLKIPPVDDYIKGYIYCAHLFNAKVKVLVGYSQDFVDQSKCKTVATNQLNLGSQVVFQVAGGCGIGALKAAADNKKWGIGVDKDQYGTTSRILTSAVKRVDVGVYSVAKLVRDGKFKGGADLRFNLKNKGISVGKIDANVPKSFITKMNVLKGKIISGKVKVPHA